MLLTLTESAKSYFISLIESQPKKLTAKDQSINLRIKTLFPGTNKADIKLSYCYFGEQNPADLAIDYGNFILYVEEKSEQSLRDAIIDYRKDLQNDSVGKLHIKAPYLKEQEDLSKYADNKLDLFSRIEIFLDKRVNPLLKSHGGVVKLIEANVLTGEVVLQFNGGCKGCSMVGFTLSHNIEKSLKDSFPEIKSIKDITNHEDAVNPYYV